MRSRALALALLAAAAVLSVPSGAARASDSITFFGGGYGHGVGMSQWGAYGLARHGWEATRILRHYYTGTRVHPVRHRPARIRVGIAQGLRTVHLNAENGDVTIHAASPTGRLVGRIPSGATWTVTRSNGRYRIVTQRGHLVGGKTWQDRPVLRYAGVHAQVRIPEAGHRYGRGWIAFGVGCSTCSMRLVAVVRAEQYLFGLGEVPTSWPMAAMEAQAVAARTYAFEKIHRLGQHRYGCDCGVLANTQDQVYAGWDKEAELDGGRWVAAVKHTRHVVITYHGSLIQAFYGSSSGGHTDSNAGAWGGTALPYLRPVCDPGDYAKANPLRAWSRRLFRLAIGERISHATGQHLGSAVRFVHTSRDASHRIRQTTFLGRNGSVTITGATLEYALGLPSTLVWIGTNRNVVRPLRKRYDALRCRPGFAITGQIHVGGGVVQRFPNGALYRNGQRAATLWLHGAVYRKYRQRGEWRSALGLPRTDVRRQGRIAYARFESGVVRCAGPDCTVSRS
jgi:stage II sporulation protein D